MVNRKFNDFEQSVECKDEARGYVPISNDISRVVSRLHNCKTLHAGAISELAEGLSVAAFQAPLNKALKETSSDKETLKTLKQLVSSTNRLSQIAKSNKLKDKRAKRLFDSQHAVDSNGDTVSILHWLETAQIMAIAAKSAQENLINNVQENDESILSLIAEDAQWEWSTELMGKNLPELYLKLYPNAVKGGNQGQDNNLQGPLYTFVRMAMKKLGYGLYSANAVREACRKTNFFAGW